MLTRVFLAAGAAALAIAAPVNADPGGHGGGGGGQHEGGGGPHGGGGGGGGQHEGGGAPAFAGGGEHGHGGGRHGDGGAPAFAGGGEHGHGGGGPHWGGGAPAFAGGGRGYGGPERMSFGGGGRGGRGARAEAMAGGGRWRGNGGPGFASSRVRFAHQSMRGFGGGRQQFRMAQRQQGRGAFGQQFRMAQRQHGNAFARQGHNFARQQSPAFAQRQGRAFSRQQSNAFAQRQGRGFAQQPLPGFAGQRAANAFNQPGMMGSRQQLGNSRMPPPAQQQALGSIPFGVQRLGGHGQGFVGQNSPAGAAYAQNWAASPYAGLSYGNNVQVLPVEQVQGFIGAPVAQVASIAPLSPIPAEISYLYPATPDYYYEWGDGYLYQIDRSDNLIAALVPLIAGGYLPGEYLPASYMASYVPDYYGFDSFYPDYGDVCNRYYEGVIYEVDCADGYVENVVPMYAGGYGVGQLLPATYSYYNVPVQYRSMYYNTPDAGYWYSPGAIYQYDPHTSVITSVAALMAPGFTIGQPLPVGYDVYNIPLPYRATYYDTPNAWYRYNNGYIYQIDPVTQIVTAIVASLLT